MIDQDSTLTILYTGILRPQSSLMKQMMSSLRLCLRNRVRSEARLLKPINVDWVDPMLEYRFTTSDKLSFEKTCMSLPTPVMTADTQR